MVKNHDTGDVKGLEEVFRSQEISRASGSIGGRSGATSSGGHDEALLGRMFGHASHALRDSHRGNDAETRSAESSKAARATELDAPLMSERQSGTASSGGRATLGDDAAAVSTEPPWKRQSGRYWTIAALSAVIALVVAGVTAGSGQHGPTNRSAQGVHGTSRPHGGAIPPGAASTGPTAPGSLTGSIGSGALALGAPSAAAPGARGEGNEPGGHVTLSGAATTTGTPPGASGGSTGGGTSGTAPGSPGGNPPPPAASGVGSTVATVGTSVTGLANQLGSAVPAAAPATNTVAGAVSSVLESVDQAVSPTTL